MSDFTRRALEGMGGILQGDLDEAFSSIRTDLDAAGNYAPARAADWQSPPPTTLAEALDRIAYHVSSGAGATTIRVLP